MGSATSKGKTSGEYPRDSDVIVRMILSLSVAIIIEVCDSEYVTRITSSPVRHLQGKAY